jgi:hypothetical protein
MKLSSPTIFTDQKRADYAGVYARAAHGADLLGQSALPTLGRLIEAAHFL